MVLQTILTLAVLPAKLLCQKVILTGALTGLRELLPMIELFKTLYPVEFIVPEMQHLPPLSAPLFTPLTDWAVVSYFKQSIKH